MRSLIATAIFALTAIAMPASAQTTSVQIDVVGPHNPYCGTWQNNTWVPNGNCVDATQPATNNTTTTVVVPPRAPAMQNEHPADRTFQTLHGTIIGVNGHLVTIQQSRHTLVVNDSPALGREDTGRVATGRQVRMHGYWEGGVFYVTSMQ